MSLVSCQFGEDVFCIIVTVTEAIAYFIFRLELKVFVFENTSHSHKVYTS